MRTALRKIKGRYLRKRVISKFQLKLKDLPITPKEAARNGNGYHPNDCFVLGSGRSLLNLSKHEVDYVNNCPFVLGFNKYLIFYEKVGIVPTHYVIGDLSVKAELAIREVLNVCVRDKISMQFFFTHYSLAQFLGDRSFISFFKENGFNTRTSLVRRSDWLKGGTWARSMNDELFHYRGSLSSAINISAILNPGKKIKLLGVDLNDSLYFFQEEIEAGREKWGLFFNRLTPDEDQHETIVSFSEKPGIQTVLPFVKDMVREDGGDLLCGFENSFLVQEGILEFSQIIE